MNILICDDDRICVEQMCRYVREFFKNREITDYNLYEFYSGEDAVKCTEAIDIAFLDVEMDGINGIEASKILRLNNKDMVVFIITSYMGYLDDAMDEGVFRYINKPLDKNVIFRGLQKAVELCFNRQSKKILIKCKDINTLIEQDSIIYIESIMRKRYIYTEQGEYVSSDSLTYWKNILDREVFCCINKSIIINIMKVKEFNNNYIKLNGIDQMLPLSRDKKETFKQKLLMYLAGQE